jgi:hypothetical protein
LGRNTHVARVAVPSLADGRVIPAIPTRSADGGGAARASDPQYFEAVWRANKAVAQAYGLTPEDLAHILGTFPVFARKRPVFMDFLLRSLSECGV